MAFWTLIVYGVFSALLAPLLITLVNRGIFRGDRLLVGNEELVTWFLSPAGLFYLFAIPMVTLTGIVIRYAGLFQIITDDLSGDPVSVKEIAFHIAQRVHIIAKLCAFTIGSALLILLPLAAGLYFVYHIYLTQFDLNYYFTNTPPEWYRAITFGGIWAGLWLLGVLGLTAWSLPGLPAFLDGNRSIMQSIRDAWNMPFLRMLRFLKILSVIVGTWFLIRITSDALLLILFALLTDWIHSQFDSLRFIALAAGGYLFLSLSIGTIISFIGFSLTSTAITKFYYKDSPLNINMVVPGFKKLTRKTLNVFLWWLTPPRMALFAGILFTGSFSASLIITGGIQEQHRVEVIAHRANALGAPENSIAALENAITVGADYAEIDVQMTADGTVVVVHDADLMRITGDPRRIRDVTYPEISHLTLLTNQNFPSEKLRIPTLEDFLEISNGTIHLMIELKYYGFYPELGEAVIRIIRESGMENQVVLMSLSADAIRQIQSLAPELTLGYVSAVAAGDISQLPIDFAAINHQNITPQLVSSFRERGQPVYAWTVNRNGDMVEAVEKGVNGLITDDPVLAKAIVEEIAALTLAERLLLQFGFLIVDGQSALRETIQ